MTTFVIMKKPTYQEFVNEIEWSCAELEVDFFAIQESILEIMYEKLVTEGWSKGTPIDSVEFSLAATETQLRKHTPDIFRRV